METPAEISAQVQRYLGLSNGTLPAPSSSLVTGYDFLTSAADAVQSSLSAGLGAGGRADTLITNQGVPTTTTTVGGRPDRTHSWTATDLRNALFGSRHDLVFLAGHFSANDALAADYETTISTADVAARPGAFTNSLVFSAGCHSGYSLADGEGISGLTNGLDWAQAMAQQGATLIAGTGYQYADTDFLAYSAKIYSQFAAQLRTGTAGTPVRVGQALVQAKQDYLAGVGSLTGLDSKSLLEMTLYGLPMTGVDLPGRAAPVASGAGVSPSSVVGGPGEVLGLQSVSLPLSPSTAVQTRAAVGVNGTPTGTSFRWLTGPDGVQTAPAIPALPVQNLDVTSNDGSTLRGVGFRSGSYTDTLGTTPLTGAPGTETNGIHTSFGSPSFFPHRLATPNYYGALADTGDGRTRLLVTPAQYRAEANGTTSTERRYGQLGLQLFYSANTTTYGNSTPALAAPPSVSQVTGVVDAGLLSVQARITGDPSAGLQSTWITYTAETGPLHGTWQSVDLTQQLADSTLWSGSVALPAGQDPSAVRFLVQAVNGVGLVALDDASADGYVPTVAGVTPPVRTATSLALGSTTPISGRFGESVTIPVTLTGAVAGSRVTVEIGGSTGSAAVAANGTANVVVPLRAAVGKTVVTASYAGDVTRLPSSATKAFTVAKGRTLLLPNALTGKVPRTGSTARWFTLTSNGVPLQGKAILLDIYDVKLRRVVRVTRSTDQLGRVDLGGLPLVPGKLGVIAAFGLAGPGTAADPTYDPALSATVLDVQR